MPIEAYIYNHSNDGVTAAIRFHQDAVRQLAYVCTEPDQNLPPRTLSDYIADADVALIRPVSFFRDVAILWHHPALMLTSYYANGRRLRLTNSGSIKTPA